MIHFVHLPRTVGRHQAFEYLFTDEPIPARKATAREGLAALLKKRKPKS